LAANFRRGFKAETERIAMELRDELEIGAHGRLDPIALAAHLHVPIMTLHDLVAVARDDVRHFLGRGRSTFSAVTIHVTRSRRLIITNPAHATTRQMNTVCHELGHIILDHQPEAPLNLQGGRAWNGTQEREADWLAGCLLIPHEAAYAAARKGQTDEDVASVFGVSRLLATWRMRMTGARIRAQRVARFAR
jgi:hypothetical protein